MNTFYKPEMNNLNSNNVNILDLSDEILFIIFHKLNMIDVIQSFMNVNRRFRRLVLDSVYIRDFNVTNSVFINSLYDRTCSIDTEFLSIICSKIVPQIHNKIQKLTIEEFSINKILGASNYPQVYSLSLVNFEEEILYQHLTDNLILRELLSKQITNLSIDIKCSDDYCSEIVSKVFSLILSLCKNLIVLNFCNIFLTRQRTSPLFYLLSNNYNPSTLTKLKIKVTSLVDCLYLLDGPLVCLSTLIINVSQIFHPGRYIDPKKKLVQLKYFSFTVHSLVYEYDELLVPLFCRMTNLEELKLCLSIQRSNSTYVNGIELYDQFLIYMTQLKKFTFNIKTKIYNKNLEIKLPSIEDIQRSFNRRYYKQIVSYIQTNLDLYNSICHVYSIPYGFENFDDLNNFYQGGRFEKVRQLKMWDTNPFELKLFTIISKDFPNVKYLYISNKYAQQNKHHSSSIITFPHLKLLNLEYAHVDYAQLFLLKDNVHLPCLSNLIITYPNIQTITNNFTMNALHFNFHKLISLQLCQTFVRSHNFHEYFPLL